jgi:hypothetical protein
MVLRHREERVMRAGEGQRIRLRAVGTASFGRVGLVDPSLSVVVGLLAALGFFAVLLRA